MAANSYKKKKQEDPIEVKLVLGLLRGMWWLITLPFRGLSSDSSTKKRTAGSLDTREVAARWSDIQTSIGLGGTTHFGSAIVSADKLLDHVLRQKGYAGETMGDRLKSAKDDISPAVYHYAWQAHKLRNRLVHEVGGEVVSFEAKEAIKQYEAVLRELGALR
ncbi:MAG TPA: hypothetical protein VGE59_03625 [Patescibacteria group bacterium]